MHDEGFRRSHVTVSAAITYPVRNGAFLDYLADNVSSNFYNI